MAELEEMAATLPAYRNRRARTKSEVSRATLQIAGALYIAQRGECFHCPGALPLIAGRRRDFACSREHVVPRAYRAAPDAAAAVAFVLAHALCNRERADRPLTAIEWEFAAAAWRKASDLWTGSGNPFPAWIELANRMMKETTHG